jgi:hypothetical protein
MGLIEINPGLIRLLVLPWEAIGYGNFNSEEKLFV